MATQSYFDITKACDTAPDYEIDVVLSIFLVDNNGQQSCLDHLFDYLPDLGFAPQKFTVGVQSLEVTASKL